ncbi:MAG: molybdopterin-dependent oxidoreductase [Bryobacterales bacterium]
MAGVPISAPASVVDFHCVTTWSKFDNEWEGVLFRTIAEKAQIQPEAKFVLIKADGGYTTNAPLEDLMRDDVLLADWHAPEPLDPEHGAPLRLVAPHLYAWKSAKWLRGFELLSADRAGFWEQVGCTHVRRPFLEQRYGASRRFAIMRPSCPEDNKPPKAYSNPKFSQQRRGAHDSHSRGIHRAEKA